MSGTEDTGSCRCGQVCRRCGGCKAQHKEPNSKGKREYLGCVSYLPGNQQEDTG